MGWWGMAQSWETPEDFNPCLIPAPSHLGSLVPLPRSLKALCSLLRYALPSFYLPLEGTSALQMQALTHGR